MVTTRSSAKKAAEPSGDLYSVLLPTYEEYDNIGIIVWLIVKYFEEAGLAFEIIVIDDGSPDGTQDVVRKLQGVYGEDRIVEAFRPGKLGLGVMGGGMPIGSTSFIFESSGSAMRQNIWSSTELWVLSIW